jgi:voltage-gated potassium channel
MSFPSVWRGWRAKVHDILEVGDGNPIGRVINIFLIVLIIANGLAFAAETVNSVYQRYGPELEAFNTFSVTAFTIE